MIIPNIWENKKWQPNHQPVIIIIISPWKDVWILGYPLFSDTPNYRIKLVRKNPMKSNEIPYKIPINPVNSH